MNLCHSCMGLGDAPQSSTHVMCTFAVCPSSASAMSSSRGLNTYGLVETGIFLLRLRGGSGTPSDSILGSVGQRQFGLSQRDDCATSLNYYRRKMHEWRVCASPQIYCSTKIAWRDVTALPLPLKPTSHLSCPVKYNRTGKSCQTSLECSNPSPIPSIVGW